MGLPAAPGANIGRQREDTRCVSQSGDRRENQEVREGKGWPQQQREPVGQCWGIGTCSALGIIQLQQATQPRPPCGEQSCSQSAQTCPSVSW